MRGGDLPAGQAGVGSARSEQRTPSRLPAGQAGSPLSKGEKSVLFLSLSGIGNLLMQLPTIEALKKARPNWHITVWVAPRGTKAIAESQPYIDAVIEMPVSPPYQGGAGGGVVQHIRNIIALRKHRFDIGVVLSPGQLIKSALYLKLADIPIRIGNSYPYKGNSSASNFLTHTIDEQENLHDIEQNLRLLEPLGINPTPAPYYSLQIPEQNIEEASNFLPSYEGRRGGVERDVPTPSRSPLYKGEKSTYIGIHAGCAKGFEFKQWPLERFAEVAKSLMQKNPNTKFLIFGGKDEEDQKQELVGMINSYFSPSYEGEPACPAGRREGVVTSEHTPTSASSGDSPLSKGEKFAISISAPLLTTAAIIQHCNLFISNDSGLMHIAAAVGTPTIGIFGPIDEALTGPRGPQSTVVRALGTTPVYKTENRISLGVSPHASLLAITPQMVLDKISL